MRIALGISYEGTAYRGWQSQQDLAIPTLQDSLQIALSKVADQPIEIICAGRTDAGVHALGQVVHFDTDINRDNRAWFLGTNSYLPRDIRIDWVKPVSTDFHARFSAIAREYRYVIFNHPVHSAILHSHASWCYKPLDAIRMQHAAQFLIGKHDFSSFRAAACQAKSPIRTIHHLNVYRKNQFIFIDIKANAFLHHMVRNITGMLMAIGCQKYEPDWAQQLLSKCDRAQGDITAPANGLYFMRAEYPTAFALPESANTLLFF